MRTTAQVEKFYSAEIKINQAKNDGFVIPNEIIAKVANAVIRVETKLSEIRKADSEQAFHLLLSLIHI